VANGGGEASSFSLYRFVMGVVFYVSALFLLAPAYAGVKVP